MRWHGWIGASVVVLQACGGTQSDTNGGRDGGSKAGSSGTQGASGRGGAGTAGSGGSGTEPECKADTDCVVQSDCCHCDAAPAGQTPSRCDITCIQSACGARDLEGVGAVCRANRCVFALSCDPAEPQCFAIPPSCPSGMVPSIQDGCYGPCIAPSECERVGSCELCDPGRGEVCVKDDRFLPRGASCVRVSPDCALNPTCECAKACPMQCGQTDGGLGCFCVTC